MLLSWGWASLVLLAGVLIVGAAAVLAYAASPRKASTGDDEPAKQKSKRKNKESKNRQEAATATAAAAASKPASVSGGDGLDIEDLALKSLVPVTVASMKSSGVKPYTMEERVTRLAELDASPGVPSFRQTLQAHKLKLARARTEVLQLNIGLYCNQACSHCHVDSSPRRKEMMSRAVADKCLDLARRSPSVNLIDVTGGAPELNREFRYLVREAHKLGLEVIDRCNLTVLLEPTQRDLAAFLAEHEVHVIASLPCYLEGNVDGQRGDQVFQRSILGLRLLNSVGYGRDPKLKLDLVYNPTGPHLPPPASKLEGDYKRVLEADYGVVFNRLVCITNMPINRYYDHLKGEAKLDAYMQILVSAFNPAAVEGLMCRNYLSVKWDGSIYDCDFNQQVELFRDPPGTEGRSRTPLTVFEIDRTDDLLPVPIATGKHCFGCTAGQGSS